MNPNSRHKKVPKEGIKYVSLLVQIPYFLIQYIILGSHQNNQILV